MRLDSPEHAHDDDAEGLSAAHYDKFIDNWAVARTKGTMRPVNRGVPGFIVERACFAFRVACCASLPTLPIGLEAAGDKVKDGEARGGGG